MIGLPDAQVQAMVMSTVSFTAQVAQKFILWRLSVEEGKGIPLLMLPTG